MSHFSLFAAATPAASPAMPLAHTTDWFVFRALKGTPTLVPDTCKFFNEDLLYFYYGRPAFRKHFDVEPTSLSSFHLVSMIFDGGTLPSPRRVYPFDSGAFFKGLYTADLHPGMKLEHFELEPTLDGAARAVNRFYGSNKAYFRETLRTDLVCEVDDLEVESYRSIVSSSRKAPADDRRSAIEIQIAQAVQLVNSKVHAVILPEQFLDDANTYDFITRSLNAEPLAYYCPHARPAEDARVILNEALRFYRAQGWV